MTAAATSSEWMTPEEVAKYLKIKPDTVRYWARIGKLKGHKLSGTKRVIWRFRQRDVDATLVESSAVPAERGTHCE